MNNYLTYKEMRKLLYSDIMDVKTSIISSKLSVCNYNTIRTLIMESYNNLNEIDKVDLEKNDNITFKYIYPNCMSYFNNEFIMSVLNQIKK